MNLHIVENGELVAYERKGECNHCGQCCCKNTIAVKIAAVSGEHSDNGGGEISDYEGWSTFRDQGLDWWIRYDVLDEQRKGCSSLVDGLCAEYESRPAACRYFPVNPRDVEKFDCGFWFERLDG